MIRENRSRLSRRTFLVGGATLAAGSGAALVFGCGGGNGSNATQTPSETRIEGPRQGGEVVIGRLLPVLGLDPHLDVGGQDITQLIYSNLYRWDWREQTAIFNDFAESLEIPDPAGIEFIFSLRRGVALHAHPDNPASGEELTSTDCRESLIRRSTSITNPDQRLALIIGGTGFPDANAVRAALRTPDPYTFAFELTRRFSPLMSELGKPEWAIVPAKVIDQSAEVAARVKAWGSGPFMVEEFEGEDRIVLARHAQYFLTPRPWLDRITYEVDDDPDSLVSGLESARFDAITSPITREKADELIQDARFTVSQAPTRFYPCIHFKTHGTQPFNDRRVREAIDLALDRQRMIDDIWGGEANHNGPIPWTLERWALPQEELRKLYRYDPGEARRLLEEAGYANGFTTRLTIPAVPGAEFVAEMASGIVEDLSMAGIRATIDEAELGSFLFSELITGEFEMAFFPNLPYEDPDRPLSFYHTRGVTGGGNWNNYTNPKVDELIEAQSVEADESRRRDIIFQAQRLMISEHGPQITLPSGYFHYARQAHIHYPYEIGESPAPDTGPWGADIWTEEL